MYLDDGRRLGFENAAEHWRAARLLLDQVGPRDSRNDKPAPARDEIVQSWYRVTTAYQQRIQQYQGGHLERALALFPEDAELHFFNGCLHVRSVVYLRPLRIASPRDCSAGALVRRQAAAIRSEILGSAIVLCVVAFAVAAATPAGAASTTTLTSPPSRMHRSRISGFELQRGRDPAHRRGRDPRSCTSKFTTSGVSGTVQSARLQITAQADGLAVYSTSTSWTETGITWNTYPIHKSMFKNGETLR